MLRHIRDDVHAGIRVAFEPVDEWCAPVLPGQQGMLQAFYADPDANGFAFQMYVLLSRAKQARQLCAVAPREQPLLMERCTMSDFALFGSMLKRSGRISEAQWVAYKGWHDEVSDAFRPFSSTPDATVYLRCSPDVCMRRITRRDRDGETTMQREYLSCLHDAHEEWIETLVQRHGAGRVLVLDAEEEGPDAVARLAESITRFMLSPPADQVPERGVEGVV